MKKSSPLWLLMFMGAFFSAHDAFAREQLRVVGSSTVYQFVATSAEQFGRNTEFRTPVVESTGTGGGIKLFCEGVGENFPDIANASRRIKKSELELCHKNGVNNIMEISIGFDGIALIHDKSDTSFQLTTAQLFLALARDVPVNGELKANPYRNWSDIDKSLPDRKIEVYGPPPTSGTRDAFAELVMERACSDIVEFTKKYPEEKLRKKNCQLMREDGAYIEVGEDDNITLRKVLGNIGSVGIFGHSYYEENKGAVNAIPINSVEPETQNISTGKYPVSRSLFVYFKLDHLNLVKGLLEFAAELASTNATGSNGYLVDAGLIPLPEDRHEMMQTIVKNKVVIHEN